MRAYAPAHAHVPSPVIVVPGGGGEVAWSVTGTFARNGGVSAAIGNAVYHATGRRIRSLPITLDKLL